MNKLRTLYYSIVVALSFTMSFIVIWFILYLMGLLPFVIWWIALGLFVIATMWFDIIGGKK